MMRQHRNPNYADTCLGGAIVWGSCCCRKCSQAAHTPAGAWFTRSGRGSYWYWEDAAHNPTTKHSWVGAVSLHQSAANLRLRFRKALCLTVLIPQSAKAYNCKFRVLCQFGCVCCQKPGSSGQRQCWCMDPSWSPLPAHPFLFTSKVCCSRFVH